MQEEILMTFLKMQPPVQRATCFIFINQAITVALHTSAITTECAEIWMLCQVLVTIDATCILMK